MTSAAKIATALACVVSLASSSPVSAQDDVWPTRPVRLIAPSGCVSTLQRSSSTPTIPTCDELGLTGFNIATMMGLHAPAGTSPKIVARLQAEIARSMREPAMAARMAQLGMVMEERGTSHYAAFMREDMARYEQAVRKLNLQQPK